LNFRGDTVRQINRKALKEGKSILSAIEEKETGEMHAKIFMLDHTAEVLENYRKIEEIKIYNAIRHEEKETLAALKEAGRQKQNLILDYEAKYRGAAENCN